MLDNSSDITSVQGALMSIMQPRNNIWERLLKGTQYTVAPSQWSPDSINRIVQQILGPILNMKRVPPELVYLATVFNEMFGLPYINQANDLQNKALSSVTASGLFLPGTEDFNTTVGRVSRFFDYQSTNDSGLLNLSYSNGLSASTVTGVQASIFQNLAQAIPDALKQINYGDTDTASLLSRFDQISSTGTMSADEVYKTRNSLMVRRALESAARMETLKKQDQQKYNQLRTNFRGKSAEDIFNMIEQTQGSFDQNIYQNILRQSVQDQNTVYRSIGVDSSQLSAIELSKETIASSEALRSVKDTYLNQDLIDSMGELVPQATAIVKQLATVFGTEDLAQLKQVVKDLKWGNLETEEGIREVESNIKNSYTYARTQGRDPFKTIQNKRIITQFLGSMMGRDDLVAQWQVDSIQYAYDTAGVNYDNSLGFRTAQEAAANVARSQQNIYNRNTYGNLVALGGAINSLPLTEEIRAEAENLIQQAQNSLQSGDRATARKYNAQAAQLLKRIGVDPNDIPHMQALLKQGQSVAEEIFTISIQDASNKYIRETVRKSVGVIDGITDANQDQFSNAAEQITKLAGSNLSDANEIISLIGEQDQTTFETQLQNFSNRRKLSDSVQSKIINLRKLYGHLNPKALLYILRRNSGLYNLWGEILQGMETAIAADMAFSGEELDPKNNVGFIENLVRGFVEGEYQNITPQDLLRATINHVSPEDIEKLGNSVVLQDFINDPAVRKKYGILYLGKNIYDESQQLQPSPQVVQDLLGRGMAEEYGLTKEQFSDKINQDRSFYNKILEEQYVIVPIGKNKDQYIAVDKQQILSKVKGSDNVLNSSITQEQKQQLLNDLIQNVSSEDIPTIGENETRKQYGLNIKLLYLGKGEFWRKDTEPSDNTIQTMMDQGINDKYKMTEKQFTEKLKNDKSFYMQVLGEQYVTIPVGQNGDQYIAANRDELSSKATNISKLFNISNPSTVDLPQFKEALSDNKITSEEIKKIYKETTLSEIDRERIANTFNETIGGKSVGQQVYEFVQKQTLSKEEQKAQEQPVQKSNITEMQEKVVKISDTLTNIDRNLDGLVIWQKNATVNV